MLNSVSRSNLVLVTLGEIVKGSDLTVIRNFNKQIQVIYGKEREHPLLKKHYHFSIGGASPFSEELSNAISTLSMCNYFRKIIGDEELLVSSECYETAEKHIKHLLSEKEYEFLADLGKKFDGIEKYVLKKN